MIEKEMEDLIATYPGDFFPEKHLELVERQKIIPHVGEFNILFKDESGEKILIKIIARSAQNSDVAQFSSYYKHLNKLGYDNISVWLVSPHISSEIKMFFDLVGIPSFEISESKFQHIATSYNHKFKNSREQLNSLEQSEKSNCGKKIQPRIKKKFTDRLKSLEQTFPAAYSFLDYPRKNKNFTYISLTTDANAHLHVGRYFLAYIVMNLDANIIKFIPRPNHGNLPEGAIDGHPFLFSSILPQLIAEFNGVEKGWVKQDELHIKSLDLKLPIYIFTRNTPDSFFTSLISAIENLDCKKMAGKYPFVQSL